MNSKQVSPDMIKQIDKVCSLSPVIPVLTISDVKHAVPIAEALVKGGLKVLEVTLRTKEALESIKAITKHVPEATVGAGTILNPDDYQRAVDHGSEFIVSPGITDQLLEYGTNNTVPLLPGIQSVSEMMTGIQYGYQRFKFFPAELSGGINVLKAFQGPFGHIRFCPTGGIRVNTAANYLALSNVMCVGGTWLTPADLVAKQEWPAITSLAEEAVKAATN